MSLKLNLEVQTPLNEEDSEVLQGLSVMLHAVGSRNARKDEEETPEEVADMINQAICGAACSKRRDHPGEHAMGATN